MSFYNILKKEKAAVLLFFCSSFFAAIFYYLTYENEFLIYPIVLNLFFLAIYIIYKYIKYKSFCEKIDKMKTSPSYEEDDDENKEVFECIKEIHKSYISKIYSLDSRFSEREKLLVEWIHNMKTSVAVIDLAIEKLDKSDAALDIQEECKLLKDNLEGALNIFRLEEFTNDYVPEKINLKELVKDAVNKQKRSFIYEKIYPKIEIDESLFVFTDKKWGGYVISQLMSNAIKYSKPEGKVLFSAKSNENKVTLEVKDSGIGIKKEELKRVFEAFYTGSNGRNKIKSTGVGLYMCRNICEKLKNEITIESIEDNGTVVSVTYQRAK